MALEGLCKSLPLHILAHPIIQHTLDKRLRLARTHAHRLCPSQIKAAHHRRLIRCRTHLVRKSESVRQLHDHLHEAVRRTPDGFDRFFAEFGEEQVVQLIGVDGGLKGLGAVSNGRE